MFRIGEFSKITQVSIRMLRYYDETGLLIPKEVDKITGYRLYSSSQIKQLNRILFLKNLGFSVKKIQELLHNWEIGEIQEELLKQKVEIEQNIQKEKERLIRLEGYLDDLKRKEKSLNTQIMIKSIPAYYVISLRKVLPSYYSEGLLWQELTQRMPHADYLSSFSIYHDFDFKEKDVDIEACIILKEPLKKIDTNLTRRQTKAVDKAACFMVYGPYKNISTAYNEFGYWLEQHQEYRMLGENRQICHVSECDTNDPEEFVTELQIPIEVNPQ
ncbi:MAG: MerR family transcriptional regulator [Candidatus Galacturonibacter soehngenii]|nr:MerR family transcriptional regulator [Candidatus Galacturonibacter soehngenii]